MCFIINQKQLQSKNSLLAIRPLNQTYSMQEKEMLNKNHKMVYCHNERWCLKIAILSLLSSFQTRKLLQLYDFKIE